MGDVRCVCRRPCRGAGQQGRTRYGRDAGPDDGARAGRRPTVALAAPAVPATKAIPKNGHKPSPKQRSQSHIRWQVPSRWRSANHAQTCNCRYRRDRACAPPPRRHRLSGRQPRPTLALSAYTVFPGDAIFATASNVPPTRSVSCSCSAPSTSFHSGPMERQGDGKSHGAAGHRRRHTYRQALLASSATPPVTFTVVLPGTSSTIPRSHTVDYAWRTQAPPQPDWQSNASCEQLPPHGPASASAKFSSLRPVPSPKPSDSKPVRARAQAPHRCRDPSPCRRLISAT